MVLSNYAAPVRVIHLDDDVRVLKAIGRLLKTMDINVVSVPSCAAARHAAAEVSDPDLIIADRMLPDGDGVACAAELRARYGCATLVLSASVEPEGPVEGIDRWMKKPGDGRAILEAVGELLGGRVRKAGG